jgi:Rieske Fe-S protein
MEDVARRVAWVAAFVLVTTMAAETPARATDAEVTSDTSSQFYDVASPTGQTVLMRRRLTSTLGVGAYNIFDAPLGDPNAPQIDLRRRLRGK